MTTTQATLNGVDLEAPCDYVKSTSPVLDMLTKPVPVSVTLES